MVATQTRVSANSMPVNGTVAQTEPRPMRWTTDQFQQMGELGIFEGRHVELLEGEIFEMTVGTAHFTTVMLVMNALQKAFGESYVARPQGPLNINQRTDPEPDIAVVEGSVRDYATVHPTNAVLVVEVSDTTLQHDRSRKFSLYARAGVADYWIVNIEHTQVEVYRQPTAMPDQTYGYGYAEVKTLTAGESVAPVAAPASTVAVADLLP